MTSRSQYKRMNEEDLDVRVRFKPGQTTESFDDDEITFSHGRKRSKRKSDHWTKEQFLKPKRGTPWKSIVLAVVLFVVGTILLLCGSLIHVGHVDNEKYGDRLWPLIIFGLLMFIPGSYHVYIVANVFLGKPGFTFDEFPQFED